MSEPVNRSETRTSMLESHFPHIVQGLLAHWHDADETAQFLDSVLIDERYSRHGLPEEAFTELMFIADLNWKRRHFNEDGVEFTADSFSFGRV